MSGLLSGRSDLYEGQSCAMDSQWFAKTATSSEMGSAVLAFPWDTTPLGAISTWEESLRQVARICFSTRFPVLITWGPELTMIYNDAYREFLGTKKSLGALGAPVREVWGEIWDEIGPLFDSVMSTREPTWTTDAPLVVNRSGYEETAYFTYSYSPLIDDAGRVAGVLDIVTETTDQVVSHRHLTALAQLHLVLQEHQGSSSALMDLVVDTLAHSENVGRCAVYLMAPSGLALAVASDADVDESLDAATLELVCNTGVAASDGAAFIAPLVPNSAAPPAGVLVMETPSGSPFDETHESFVLLVSAAVTAAMRSAESQKAQLDYVRAHAELAELREGRVREASITLQQSLLTPPPEPDHLEIVVRYQPAGDDLEIGGDWYDAFLTKDGAATIVVGDVTGHDHKAAAMMGQLRGLIRTTAYITGGTPAEVLTEADGAIFGLGLGDGATATAIVARIEQGPEDKQAGVRTVRWSNAGHPYPVVIRADGQIEVLNPGNDLLLGILPTVDRHDHAIELRDDDTLFLYTDGLVERADVPLAQGLDLLITALDGAHERTLDDLSDHLLSLLAPGAEADDVALVLLRAFPQDEPRPAEAGPESLTPGIDAPEIPEIDPELAPAAASADGAY